MGKVTVSKLVSLILNELNEQHSYPPVGFQSSQGADFTYIGTRQDLMNFLQSLTHYPNTIFITMGNYQGKILLRFLPTRVSHGRMLPLTSFSGHTGRLAGIVPKPTWDTLSGLIIGDVLTGTICQPEKLWRRNFTILMKTE